MRTFEPATMKISGFGKTFELPANDEVLAEMLLAWEPPILEIANATAAKVAAITLVANLTA